MNIKKAFRRDKKKQKTVKTGKKLSWEELNDAKMQVRKRNKRPRLKERELQDANL